MRLLSTNNGLGMLLPFLAKRFFLLFLCLVFLVSCTKDEDWSDPPSRTIIVYMAADNNLSYDAYDNIQEMQNGFSEKGANLIVFMDPADDVPQILQIKHGSTTRVKTYSEFNSAEATQMGKVLSDIVEMYPAESYGLVLWSHGTSWLPAGRRLRSFGEDDGQQMNIPALAAILPVHFDFILMDACLMGSIEVVYELKDKADFILASSTEIISNGFPYDRIIPELIQAKPDLIKVATNYFNFYNQQQGAFRSATISLVNTKELDNLATITGQLLTGQTFDSETFDRLSVQRLDVFREQYAFDLLDFIEKAFPNADTGPFEDQLGKTILYKAHTPEFIEEFTISTYCGLSCYIPSGANDDLKEFYQQLAWSQDSEFHQLFR